MPISAAGLGQAVQDQWQLSLMRIDEWKNTVFSLNWFVLLALFVINLFLWFRLADKRRLAELALYTALIIIWVSALDELGEEMSLWHYTADIIPLSPPITAIDITCLPLLYMLIYQYTNRWPSFLIATAVMSVVFCFVFEPIFIRSGIYIMLAWKNWYGLPIYFLIGVATRFIMRRIMIAIYKAHGMPGQQHG